MTKARSKSEAIIGQFQMIDTICGVEPGTKIEDWISTVSIVCDQDDFNTEQSIVEIPANYANKITTILDNAGLAYEVIKADSERQTTSNRTDSSSIFGRIFRKNFDKRDSNEIAIIKTTLKADKVYNLIDEIKENEGSPIEVELTIL